MSTYLEVSYDVSMTVPLGVFPGYTGGEPRMTQATGAEFFVLWGTDGRVLAQGSHYFVADLLRRWQAFNHE